MNAEPPIGPLGISSRSRGRHARLLAALLAAVALFASGCAAGQVTETADQKPTLDGVNADAGQMALRALSVEAPPVGLASYPVGSDAGMRLVLVNNSTETDTLTSVTTRSAAGWSNFADYNAAFQVQQASLAKATGSSSPTSANASSSAEPLPTGTRSVLVQSGHRVSFGTPDAQGALLLLGLRSKLFPGTTIRITFSFAKAGSVTVDVPVHLADTKQGPIVGEDEGE